MEESKNIVVKVKVKVPTSQTTTKTQTLSTTPACPAGTTTVGRPSGGVANVRQNNVTGVNYICASGTSYNTTSTCSARTVFAKMVAAGTTSVSLPGVPPADARAIVVNRSDGTWCFKGSDVLEIAGAVCAAGSGSGSGAANTLALWIDWGTDPMEVQAINFQGVCSTHTDDCAYRVPQFAQTAPTPSARVAVAEQLEAVPKAYRVIPAPGEGKGGRGRAGKLVELLAQGPEVILWYVRDASTPVAPFWRARSESGPIREWALRLFDRAGGFGAVLTVTCIDGDREFQLTWVTTKLCYKAASRLASESDEPNAPALLLEPLK